MIHCDGGSRVGDLQLAFHALCALVLRKISSRSLQARDAERQIKLFLRAYPAIGRRASIHRRWLRLRSRQVSILFYEVNRALKRAVAIHQQRCRICGALNQGAA